MGIWRDKFHFKTFLPLWRVFMCNRGKHREYSYPTNEPVNFCEACHAQLNPNMYSWWHVRSKDGTLDVEVAAISEFHARAFFLHEWHPSNLTVTHKGTAEGMTVDQWRDVMKGYIEQVPPARAAGMRGSVKVKM